MVVGNPSVTTNTIQITPVVALSTGCFSGEKRCMKKVTIYGNGRQTDAMVVDECDSTMGCDNDHDYQPPCDNIIVDVSKAVWKALGVPKGPMLLLEFNLVFFPWQTCCCM